MARTKILTVAPEYRALRTETLAAGDENDCFPTAAAILTGLPLSEVREAFAAAGRKTGKGTPWAVAHEALKALGFKLVKKDWRWTRDMIDSYPGVHKNLKNITTRHPARFAKAWEGQNVLLHSHAHVSAVRDGAPVDWSINRSKHVIAVYDIVKL